MRSSTWRSSDFGQRGERLFGLASLDRGLCTISDIADESYVFGNPGAWAPVVEVEQGDEIVVIDQRHVEHRARMDRFQRGGGRGGTRIFPGVGDGNQFAAFQVLDIGPIVAKMQYTGQAGATRIIPVALDRDGLGNRVDDAVACSADAQCRTQDFGCQERHRGRVVHLP